MYSSSKSAPIAALALVLASTASAYTLNNVTVDSADSSILYYSPCGLKTWEGCNGAWIQINDDRFYDGSAMLASDPTHRFGDVEPYFAYTFRGSAFYMYQWMNSSTAVQLQYYDNNRKPQVNLTRLYPQYAESSNLTSVLAWSLEGLDPLEEHTIGIQHQARADGTPTQLVFDYMIVTTTTLEPGDVVSEKKKLSGGAIAGIVIGAIVGVVAIVGAFFAFRRHYNNRAAAKAKGGRQAWEGSFVKPSTLKFMDPSSEIEASEQIAREGRLEEEIKVTSPAV